MIDASDILNAKVLIVDDLEANVRLLEKMLRDVGYVSIASTMAPHEVCGLHLRNRYDLILLDLQMPGMDGFRVMEELKEIESDGYLPVIVITAQPAHKQRALEAGAKDFVSKPFDVLEVKTRIHNMLEVRLLYKERNRLNQVLQERNVELESARSVAEKSNLAKSDFLSIVSHELRTPLTSIRGALALIVGGVVGVLPAAARPLIEIAHKNSERLILLVNDLLDMEKIEAGKMEFDMQPTKLMPLLQQALDGNRAYAEQYQVSFELESELPEAMVSVDSNRMMQVFFNLLSNAAKYSPAGGKVLVAVEHMGQRIRVAVKDNGPGIPDEFKDHIFQKFAQADSSDTRKKGGTGLGLSIAKAIVEKMGGSIGFDSQPNVQTEFYVEFPGWLEKMQPEIGPCVAGSVHRVLVCEDSRDTATVLRMMLEHAGYAVDIAYDASQAKQLLAQGGYAAMTLDIAMPGQSGISLIRELHENETIAAPPILVVSANAAEGRHELAGEEFGVVEWIDKPVIQERLLSVLKGVVGRSGRTRLKVLHVEGDPDIFHVMHKVASEVAEVVQAADLAEARSLLAQSRYDLVILDLDLPDGSGKELLPLLRSAMPPIPVMVFSVYEIGAEEAREVDAVLVKSRTDNVELLATIKRLIGAE